MNERRPETQDLAKEPRVWPLVAVLLLALVPWVLTGAWLGVGCENREGEWVCEASSTATWVLWLLALEACQTVGWLVARGRRSSIPFIVSVTVALALNLSATVLVGLWASGDL